MSWLAQIIMFLVLGLFATPSQFLAILPVSIALGLFLIFVARPVAVWLCLIPFRFPRQETAFISWVGLRGAVSILLAITPLLGGLEHGRAIFNTAFIVVLVSLVVQGWTVGPLARRLGLIVPQRIGPLEKVELELPGSAHHELLAYTVVAGSPVARGERIPRWARPSLVVRDGRSMKYQDVRPPRRRRPCLHLRPRPLSAAARPAVRQPHRGQSRRRRFLRRLRRRPGALRRGAGSELRPRPDRRRDRSSPSASSCSSGSAAVPNMPTA